MFKDKDIFTFVRFGGLNIKKQKGFGKDTFHSPPTTKGFYAMPKIAQEYFLIGSLDKTQPSIFPKERKLPNGEYKDINKIYSQIRKEFRKTNGNIWSHLGEYLKPNEIIDRHNDWVKSDIKSWASAFAKMSLVLRYGHDQCSYKSINSVRGITGIYSKDHCEVFFDEKI